PSRPPETTTLSLHDALPTSSWTAPISSTSSPGRTAASATIRAAHSSVSGCQPHARRDRTEADMADHVQEGGTHRGDRLLRRDAQDRKSTRLNSSHEWSSYAV